MYRALPILLSYLLLAGSLQLHAYRTIYKRYHIQEPQNRRHSQYFYLFALLAALSLAATWYYMFAFFAHSYQTWESSLSQDQKMKNFLDFDFNDLSLASRLELWLQNTKLFREAWETVIETPARFWWSGQIFLWTTGWSVFLGVMARRYRIPHVWTYMLLGQIVAISFAMNLFFATILASKQQLASAAESSDADDKNNDKNKINDNDDHRYVTTMAWQPPLSAEVVPVAISLLSTALVPSVAHTRYFMLVLLVPHLLLFIPALLRPSCSSGDSTTSATTTTYSSKGLPRIPDGLDTSTKRYVTFFKWLLSICVLLHAHVTYVVISEDIAQPGTATTTAATVTATFDVLVRRLIAAMYDHPAVSSVSWDVVFCTIGAIAWAAVHGGDLRRMLGGTQTGMKQS